MIVFNLVCNNSHRFEGWFNSSGDFEEQGKAEQICCPVCGAKQIAKAPQAPYINTSGLIRRGHESNLMEKSDTSRLVNVGNELSSAIDYILTHAEDVGDSFPEEARKIHYQEAQERNIRGQASPDEILELKEEGVNVVALPLPAYRLRKPH